MAQQIQIRRDTSTNWTSVNPTLAQGELGFETNTNKIKIGDGTTAWNSLAYYYTSNSMASLLDVTFTSLVSGQVPVANASGIFINQSLASLVNQLVSFSSLGSLAFLNSLSYYALDSRLSLGSLAVQNNLSYFALDSRLSLGSLAVQNNLSYFALDSRLSLGSLAVQNNLSYFALDSRLSLGSLAVISTVDAPLVNLGTRIGVSLASISHNSLGNLTTGDPHTQYALLAGRTGGQSFYGGNASGNRLYLYGTTTANGDMFIQNGGGQTMIGVNGTFDSNETLQVYKSIGSVGGTNVNFNTSKTVAGGFNYGLYNKVDISVTTGSTDSVQGLFNYVNNSNLGTVNFVEAFTQRIDNTGTGSIGEASNIKIFTPTSNGAITTLYGIYLEPQTGTGITTGWSIYADGGKMFHRDPMQIGNTTFGAAAAYLDVRQLSTTATYPTLRLEQSDLSEEFIQFQTTIGTGNPIVASSTATTFSHKIRISVNGTFKFLYAYNG